MTCKRCGKTRAIGIDGVHTCTPTVEWLIAEAVAKEREECAFTASNFTMKPDASIYPDIPFDQMNDAARMVSHTTAQQIAWAIRARGEAK